MRRRSTTTAFCQLFGPIMKYVNRLWAGTTPTACSMKSAGSFINGCVASRAVRQDGVTTVKRRCS